MSALKDVQQATSLALENLANAHDTTAEAVAAADYAVDRAESLGIRSWIEGAREIQAAVTVAAKALAGVSTNLERARDVAQAMGNST